jgi:hypothetical protein
MRGAVHVARACVSMHIRQPPKDPLRVLDLRERVHGGGPWREARNCAQYAPLTLPHIQRMNSAVMISCTAVTSVVLLLLVMMRTLQVVITSDLLLGREARARRHAAAVGGRRKRVSAGTPMPAVPVQDARQRPLSIGI